MILGEPPRTQADLNFSLFGFPIRVTPWFWLMAALLGYGASRGGDPHLLLSWIVAVFLSILIHELGHAFAFRHYGTSARIVLLHFGGLAIPEAQGAMLGRRPAISGYGHMFVSFAGPAAQLATAAILIATLIAFGYEAPMPGFLSRWFNTPQGQPIAPDSLYVFVVFFLYASIYWALLNLLPVYPLDGGQIAREILLLRSGAEGIKHSLILSVATGGLLAIYGLTQGQTFLGIMFGMLAYSSYQTLQSYMGHGGGFGRGW